MPPFIKYLRDQGAKVFSDLRILTNYADIRDGPSYLVTHVYLKTKVLIKSQRPVITEDIVPESYSIERHAAWTENIDGYGTISQWTSSYWNNIYRMSKK